MSIQYMVLGFEPTTLEHESPPITTRPGLPPASNRCLFNYINVTVLFTNLVRIPEK